MTFIGHRAKKAPDRFNNEGTRYVYFTSSRSSLVELAAWMGNNPMKGDPFQGATSHEIHVGGQALNYTDIMLEKTD